MMEIICDTPRQARKLYKIFKKIMGKNKIKRIYHEYDSKVFSFEVME